MKEFVNELSVEELSLLEDEIKSELINRFKETNFEEFLSVFVTLIVDHF